MTELNYHTLPEFFQFSMPAEAEEFIRIKAQKDGLIIIDRLEDQLVELIKCRNPNKWLNKEQTEVLVKEHTGDIPLVAYGTWVYYPWNNQLVHLLPENEFVEIRTNRNQYKITPQEQNLLSKKRVGIIGLSVGQSVALTMAMERSFGELRISDFDTLDLSNLNRIRGKVSQLGLPKTVICAREISELDPYLKVTIYEKGIDENNIDLFLTANGKLDLLIEECDGLDVKILARDKARSFGIPVLMETNDRGLLDIERFDIEPERPLLHGLIGDLNPTKLKGLSPEEKIEYLLPMVGSHAISERMKASMIEVQHSILSWPQLASAVTMGGGLAAEMARKILLNLSTVSGRFYVDVDQLIPENTTEVEKFEKYEIDSPLMDSEVIKIAKFSGLAEVPDVLSDQDRELIVNAAIAAPSGGNAQPWKLTFYKGYLLLIHDIYYSQSFLDYAHLGTYVAFGAMIENIRTQCEVLGYKLVYSYFPNQNETRLVAACNFEPAEKTNNPDLEAAIFSRITNRFATVRQPLTESFKAGLNKLAEENKPARLTIIENPQTMKELAEVFSSAEMHWSLHPQGHSDIFNKELRFSESEVLETRDGLDVATLNMSKVEIMALKIASSRKAIEWVEKIGGGEAFKKNTKKAISLSSALGIISMPFYSPEAYLYGGEFLQKLWLGSTLEGYSFQPVTQYNFLDARLVHGAGIGFDENYKKKFKDLQNRFLSILPELATREIIFIFRLAKEKMPDKRSLRRYPEKILVKIEP